MLVPSIVGLQTAAKPIMHQKNPAGRRWKDERVFWGRTNSRDPGSIAVPLATV